MSDPFARSAVRVPGPPGLGLQAALRLGSVDRQCGRCRQVFAPDPEQDQSALEEWWLCAPCRQKLFGSVPSSSVVGAAHQIKAAAGPASARPNR